MKFLKTILASLVFPCLLFGQLNLLVGYQAAHTSPKQFNTIQNRFDLERPWLDDHLGDMKIWQGLRVGLRYKTPLLGIEGAFVYRARSFDASGKTPSGNDFETKTYLRNHLYSIGFESYFGKFGIGASVDGGKMSLRFQSDGAGSPATLLDPWVWSSHVYATLHLQGSPRLSVALRPYAHIPWGKVDFSRLEAELNQTTLAAGVKNDMSGFGLMLIFYNGQQQ